MNSDGFRFDLPYYVMKEKTNLIFKDILMTEIENLYSLLIITST